VVAISPVVCLFQNYVCAKDLPESCARVSERPFKTGSHLFGTPTPAGRAFLALEILYVRRCLVPLCGLRKLRLN